MIPARPEYRSDGAVGHRGMQDTGTLETPTAASIFPEPPKARDQQARENKR